MNRLLTVWLMALLPLLISAQSGISGEVRNQKGEALIGANVYIENTFQGSITNINGRYTIAGLPRGNYQVYASYIGYESTSKTVEVPGEGSLDFVLNRKSYLAEEVIVTATRAGDRSPVAHTNVSREEIRARNMGQDIPFLLSLTPSMVSTSDAGTGIGYTSFRIRGTDMNRINITVNGIPLNDAESHGVWWVNMPDFAGSVDNVQVQRGVGTSANGGAAFGATLNFQTFTLNPEPYAELHGSYGSFNSRKGSITAGTGLIDNKFTVDMRLSSIQSDGFTDRGAADLSSWFVSGAYLSGKDVLRLNVFSGKEKTYQAWWGIPKVRLESDLAGMQRYEAHGLYTPEQTAHMIASNPRTYNYYTYENQTDNYQQDHYQALYSRELGNHWLLNTALHYTYGRGYYEEEDKNQAFADYGIADVVIGGTTITSTDLIRQRWLDNDFYGLTWSLNYSGRRLDAYLGGGANRYDGRHFGKVIWARLAGLTEINHEWYRNKGVKRDWNTYLKASYRLTGNLSFFGDLQYRNIQHTIRGIDNDLRPLNVFQTYGFVNPKFGTTWEISNTQRLAMSFGMASREPNRSNFVDADPAAELPSHETLLDYEVSYRLNITRAVFEVNFYHMDYHNQLVHTGQINDVGASIMTNVRDSYRSGMELVAGFLPVRRLSWDVNLTLSRNRIRNFTDHVDDWDTWQQAMTDLGETHLSFSPSLIAGSNLSYEILQGFNLSLLSKYVGKQYIDNTASAERKLNPYFVNDLQLNYIYTPEWIREIGFNLVFYNLFNESYESMAWVYRYRLGGNEYSMDGYFPQAGFHVMGGLTLKF